MCAAGGIKVSVHVASRSYLQRVDLDNLAKQADESHPLTYEGAGIPVEYCIVPRLSVLDAIYELKEARETVERKQARIDVLEASLDGAIADLAGHECQNVDEFAAVLKGNNAK